MPGGLCAPCNGDSYHKKGEDSPGGISASSVCPCGIFKHELPGLGNFYPPDTSGSVFCPVWNLVSDCRKGNNLLRHSNFCHCHGSGVLPVLFIL